MVLIALVQTLIPLAFILWLWLGRPATTIDILLRAAAAMALTLAAAQAGLWLALPRATVLVLGALLLLALFGAFRRAAKRSEPTQAGVGIAGWAGRGLTLVGAGAGATLTGMAMAGAAAPVAPVIDLAFPFEEGRYLIVGGGSTALVNPHLETLAPGKEDWRGQSYAVDMVRIDALGFRTRNPSLLAHPDDPAAYLITGTPVVAPCSGVVDAAVDGEPDPAAWRAGSHVRLRCGSNMVVLAHLVPGSIVVRDGQLIGKGAPIGAAGNSGVSDEPHLHIHAQRMPEPGAPPLSGAPVAIRFEGRVPVRNMSFAIE
jgi:Peptidase family M23